jgi:hypothetical protein
MPAQAWLIARSVSGTPESLERAAWTCRSATSAPSTRHTRSSAMSRRATRRRGDLALPRVLVLEAAPRGDAVAAERQAGRARRRRRRRPAASPRRRGGGSRRRCRSRAAPARTPPWPGARRRTARRGPSAAADRRPTGAPAPRPAAPPTPSVMRTLSRRAAARRGALDTRRARRQRRSRPRRTATLRGLHTTRPSRDCVGPALGHDARVPRPRLVASLVPALLTACSATRALAHRPRRRHR